MTLPFKLKYLAIGAVTLSLLTLGIYRYSELTAPVSVTSAVRPVQVQSFSVSPSPIIDWTFSEGTAEALRKAFLDFEQSGKVVYIGELNDNSKLREGIRVFGPADGARNGQLLAQIDSRLNTAEVRGLEARLLSARERSKEAAASLTRAENDQRQAGSDFDRMEEIYKKGVISRDQYEKSLTAKLNAAASVNAAESALQAAQAEIESISADLNKATVSLEKTSLFAPFDGIITAVNIYEENYYYPPAGINNNRDREAAAAMVIIDDSQFEVQLEVPEEHAQKLQEGQTVYLAADDRSLYTAEKAGFDQELVTKGTIWSVSPAFSLQRRSRLVKVRTASNHGKLEDGQFIQAWIMSEQKDNALAIPYEALSFQNGQPFVFVINDNNQAEKRWLETGIEGLERIEVVSGLQQDDEVVVRGQHLLSEGSLIARVEPETTGQTMGNER